MSPMQGDTAGTERATGCIYLLMSGMPTGAFIWTVTSWRACRMVSSTAWPACRKCRPAFVFGVGRESEWKLHRQTCIYHQRRPLCVVWGEIGCELKDFGHVTNIWIICALLYMLAIFSAIYSNRTYTADWMYREEGCCVVGTYICMSIWKEIDDDREDFVRRIHASVMRVCIWKTRKKRNVPIQ